MRAICILCLSKIIIFTSLLIDPNTIITTNSHRMNPLEKEYNEKDDAYYAHQRHEMLRYIPAGTRAVLDVGCSSGAFGILVKEKFGCEVWGIEPDKQSAENANKLLDKVYNSFFDNQIDFGDKTFDCIIFNDVLEHLVNPFEALELCKRYLNKDGVLVASIPNIRFFDAIYHIVIQGDFMYTGAGIFDKTHLRFFTRKSMIRMFTDAGYKINSVDGINSIKELNYKGYKNFKFINTLLFGKIADMEYLQFAISAKL